MPLCNVFLFYSEWLLLEPCSEHYNLQILNMNTFDQILELDEDDSHEFSHSMVDAYFSQAEDTFRDLDKN